MPAEMSSNGGSGGRRKGLGRRSVCRRCCEDLGDGDIPLERDRQETGSTSRLISRIRAKS